jgi:hypothetical protein
MSRIGAGNSRGHQCSGFRNLNHRAITERDLNAVTERDVRAGCGLLVVERVVDRVPCRLGAFCAC